MRCSVKGCSSDNFSKACELSFFRFPTDTKILPQWLKFCDFPENGPSFKKKVVCELHFKPDDIENTIQYEMGFASRKYLKKGTVPTLKTRDLEAEQIKQQEEYKKIIAELLEAENSNSSSSTTTAEENDGLEENEIQYDEATMDFEMNDLVETKPAETLPLMRREKRTISNSTFCDTLHESVAIQTDLTDSKMCASLSVSMDTMAYQINCFYCEANFLLQNWSDYLQHMQEKHFEDLCDGVPFKTCQTAIKQENAGHNDPLDFKSFDSDHEIDEQGDEHVAMDTIETQVAQKTEKVDDQNAEDKENRKRKHAKQKTKKAGKKSKEKTVENCCEGLCVETLEPSIVLGMLELLQTSFPLLWFIPPTSFPTYRLEVKRFHEAVIEKFMLETSEIELQTFIQDIIKWFIRIKEKNKKIDKMIKPKIDYFKKCAEFLPDKLDGSKTCEICQMNFPDYLQYSLHKQQTHNEMNETMSSEYLIDVIKMKDFIHSRWHFCIRQQQNFECKLCNTVWKLKPTKGKMERYFNHMKGHANLPEFVCDLCGKTYRRWCVFVLHRRRHTGMIKRECLICPRWFNSYWDLTLHRIKFHRPIEGTIEEIEKSLANKKYLRRKQLKYRRIEHPETKRERIVCNYCGKDFAHSSAIYVHCKKFHTSQWEVDVNKRRKNPKSNELFEEYNDETENDIEIEELEDDQDVEEDLEEYLEF